MLGRGSESTFEVLHDAKEEWSRPISLGRINIGLMFTSALDALLHHPQGASLT